MRVLPRAPDSDALLWAQKYSPQLITPPCFQPSTFSLTNSHKSGKWLTRCPAFKDTRMVDYELSFPMLISGPQG